MVLFNKHYLCKVVKITFLINHNRKAIKYIAYFKNIPLHLDNIAVNEIALYRHLFRSMMHSCVDIMWHVIDKYVTLIRVILSIVSNLKWKMLFKVKVFVISVRMTLVIHALHTLLTWVAFLIKTVRRHARSSAAVIAPLYTNLTRV